jgi:hypothetical protein
MIESVFFDAPTWILVSWKDEGKFRKSTFKADKSNKTLLENLLNHELNMINTSKVGIYVIMSDNALRPSSVFILYTICNYYSTIVYHITPSIPYHSVSEYIMPIQYHTMPHYPIPVHSIPHHTQITPKRTYSRNISSHSTHTTPCRYPHTPPSKISIVCMVPCILYHAY